MTDQSDVGICLDLFRDHTQDEILWNLITHKSFMHNDFKQGEYLLTFYP